MHLKIDVSQKRLNISQLTIVLRIFSRDRLSIAPVVNCSKEYLNFTEYFLIFEHPPHTFLLQE